MDMAKQLMVGDYVLHRNPERGFVPAKTKIDEGFRVCVITIAEMLPSGELYTEARVLNDTIGLCGGVEHYQRITKQEAEQLIFPGTMNTQIVHGSDGSPIVDLRLNASGRLEFARSVIVQERRQDGCGYDVRSEIRWHELNCEKDGAAPWFKGERELTDEFRFAASEGGDWGRVASRLIGRLLEAQARIKELEAR